MSKIKVGVAGYGVIGQRLADGVALQEDMELVGVADVAPTLPVRALAEKGMPYKMFTAAPGAEAALTAAGIPVSGTFDDLLGEVDIMLDAAPGGIGAKNKEKYVAAGVKGVFQGGEAGSVADVFFHGYANYARGVGKDYLKLTSCNTTGLIRAVDALDKAVGIHKVAITIIRRIADPGDTHRGIVDSLMMEAIPNHQAVDLMEIMPHVDATGLLVHTPITHGHIITIVATPKKGITDDEAIDVFRAHPRVRSVRIADGFTTNTSLFNYARFLGKPRGDMYEIGLFEETVGHSGDDLMFAINIPQESVTIPETIDAVRAAIPMQEDQAEAVGLTNRYLGMA
ncbi:MAG: type II glyceraldehyde-3-phosphate dehydrogenase [Actinobacteria bacterium]|nr:type II glyceraldehyde-3-phosphate dehydrogenase [Actinomycetota bacterium]MBU1493982.1 type II glyceraldehyde-3-phosphate dehydrogenase [Actinomycetota bacterium]